MSEGEKMAWAGGGPSTLLRAFLGLSHRRPDGNDRLGRVRPLSLLALDTGGCEGCSIEIGALGGAAYALERHGFRLVSEPEDADWMLVTGPVTRACVSMLERNWQAMPAGRSLVAVGDCAVDGGMFGTGYAVLGGLEALSPVRMRLAGCPPTPRDILAGLERLAGL